MDRLTVRFPAEWEPQRRTWLAWPHNTVNWKHRPGILDFYVKLTGVIRRFQPVSLLVPDSSISAVPKEITKPAAYPLDILAISTNDIWIRDYGPIFVEKEGRLELLSFGFNAWGEKFPPYDLDGRVPNEMARHLKLPITEHPIIFEGGAVETNGKGAGITTRDCLVGPRRNPEKTLGQVVDTLQSTLGLLDLLILPEGLDGDHTDGHIDNVARFLGPDHVVVATTTDPTSPNFDVLKDARRRLETWKPAGQPLTVSTLPLPPQRILGDDVLPASYMNFIYVNNGIVIPLYQCEHDAVALGFFKRVYPDRTVLGIDCSLVIEEGGSLHCMTKQEPLADVYSV